MIHLYSLLYESVEKHATGTGCSSVESERELVEVVRKVLLADSALEGTQEPSLEQRSYPVHGRHLDVSWGRRSRKHGHFVLEPERAKPGIGRPTVRFNDAPRVYHVSDETLKLGSRKIGYMSEADPSHAMVLLFHSDDNYCFLDGLTANYASFLSSHKTLVDLDAPRKALSARTDHCPSKFVKPRPSSCVALHPQHSLQAKRVRPILLGGDLPHRQEPDPQWLPSTLEDGASCQPRLGSAVTTQQDTSPGAPRCTGLATCTAEELIGPPDTLQVTPTILLPGEELVEFDNVPWVVNPGARQRASVLGHGLMILGGGAK